MSKTRLLLAEDNSDHRRFLIQSLTRGRSEVDVLGVASLDEIRKAITQESFDCIILDYRLPPHDASYILEEIRATIGQTPVIVISSSADQTVVIESLRKGVIDFVQKDVALTGDHLWDRVHSAIERSRKERLERRQSQRRLLALQRSADQDALTGLFNRRYINSNIKQQRHRADRREHISCVFFDLDHFKHVNDEHGHHAGDLVLKHFAELLKSLANSQQTLVRWGGEEFLAIGSMESLQDTWIWAENVRRKLEKELIPCGEHQTVSMTVSIGVGFFPTRDFSEAQISETDQALYLAKELGRNRVCTIGMVRAIEIAESLQLDADIPLSDRPREFLRRMGRLGATQADHVGPHSDLVRDIAMEIGLSMSLPPDQLQILEAAAGVHDIAKVIVPEEVLSKPGPLTANERLLVDEHARFGAELCQRLGLPEGVSEAVRRHHARFDLTPVVRTQLPAKPSVASVVSVADAIATMLSHRPYAAARNISQALSEINKHSGKQFDPTVVDRTRALRSILTAEGRTPSRRAA